MQCSAGECAVTDSRATPTGQSPESSEEWNHLLVALVFLACCFFGFAHGVHILLAEWSRYVKLQASDRACFRTYLEYRFGHWYAWTNGSAVIVLSSVSCTLLVAGGLLHSMVAAASISDSLWASWIWISAPDGGNSAQPGGHVIGMLVSVGGMLIFALLVSIITAGFEQVLQDLREGSLPVVEGDHTVILGWTSKTPVIIDELCNATESRGGGTFVVLATQSKPDVEKFVQQLQDQGELRLRNSKVVVRSGKMHCKEDLRRVSVETSRRVLVLADTVSACSLDLREEADARTLNILLTLNGMLKQQSHASVIVECCLVRNLQLFKSLEAEQNTMEVMTIQDFIGSLMVESSCQRGLASIINETLGFEGQEFYVRHVEGTQGWVFRDLLFAFEQVVPVGLLKAHDDEGGSIKLLPPLDYVLKGNERLILLAEDASTCPTRIPADAVTASGDPDEGIPRRFGSRQEMVRESPHVTECVVILGWNEAVGAIMFELDHLLGTGSTVIVYSPRPAAERREFLKNSQTRRKHTYTYLTVQHVEGKLGARYKLDELPLERASKIFILTESTASSTTEADGQTIAALLQVKDILRERHAMVSANLVIIPQLQGKGAREACYSGGALDCIDSNRLSARAIATVCEEPELAAVWGEFLSETGARFRIRKLSAYLSSDDISIDELTFREVAEIAASCGDIAIGWSRPDAVGEEGVCRDWEVNPKDKSKPRPWNQQAFIVSVSPPRQPSASRRLANKVRAIGAFRRHSSGSFSSWPLGDELKRYDSMDSIASVTPYSTEEPSTSVSRETQRSEKTEEDSKTPQSEQFMKHLSNLADMYSRGLLSVAEYGAAKAKLLQLER